MTALATVIARDVFASRPSASIAGRLFHASDTNVLYRDNGSSWDSIATSATGLTDPTTTDWDLLIRQSGAVNRFAKGSAGGELAMSNGTIVWNAGTSFPGSAATGDRYFRTDVLGGTLFKYDGTRWRSVNAIPIPLQVKDAVMFSGVSGATNPFARIVLPWKGTYTLYCTSIEFHTLVQTTNNGSNYYAIAVATVPSSAAVGAGFNTSADTAGTHTFHTMAVNAVLTSTDVYISAALSVGAGAPGTFFCIGAVAMCQLVTT